MKIVVVGGRNKADFLIDSLLCKHHELIVINDDEAYCEYLSNMHNIPVFYGNLCKEYTLDDAQIAYADILIALKPNDADNLVICQMAKKLFHVKKVVAIVSNPKKVAVFQKLGVNTAISATYMIAKIIEQASTVENLVNSLSIEHENIVMTEILLSDTCRSVNHMIKDICLPENIIICAILRGPKMIVPNGDTTLLRNDKLLVLSSLNEQNQAIEAFTIGLAGA